MKLDIVEENKSTKEIIEHQGHTFVDERRKKHTLVLLWRRLDLLLWRRTRLDRCLPWEEAVTNDILRLILHHQQGDPFPLGLIVKGLFLQAVPPAVPPLR